MELSEINNKLKSITEELPPKIKELKNLELAYNKRFYYCMVHSGMGNQAQREAEATLTCDQEGLWEPLLEVRSDVRILYMEKDMYIEISKNLRVIQNDIP